MPIASVFERNLTSTLFVELHSIISYLWIITEDRLLNLPPMP